MCASRAIIGQRENEESQALDLPSLITSIHQVNTVEFDAQPTLLTEQKVFCFCGKQQAVGA